MQLLLERSFEYGEHQGLGLIPGEVAPHPSGDPSGAGCASHGLERPALPQRPARRPIFADLNEGDHVYFVHSFAGFDCGACCTATAEYGAELTAAVQKDNVFGTQFHPEKSGDVGLKILKAFCQGGKSMILLPAIDLYEKKVVRLTRGDYAQMTVYNDDPVAQAGLFQEAGASGSTR